jgi:hypothetical protein
MLTENLCKDGSERVAVVTASSKTIGKRLSHYNLPKKDTR